MSLCLSVGHFCHAALGGDAFSEGERSRLKSQFFPASQNEGMEDRYVVRVKSNLVSDIFPLMKHYSSVIEIHCISIKKHF